MSLKEDFDALIKRNLINAGVNLNDFGYGLTPKNKKPKPYTNYYTNQKFNAFKDDMEKNYKAIFDKYSKGQGSELKEKSDEPPKMASVASSSRFCYLALRNADVSVFGFNSNAKFDFEVIKKNGLKTKYHPQLDAAASDAQTDYYFEFKCHEFLDSILSHQYDNLLNQIGIQRTNIICDDFDSKQFVTHLSGIVKNLTTNKNVVFSYVYFYPTNMPNDIKAVFDLMEQELKSVFTMPEIMAFCASKKITLNYYRFENDVMDGFENNRFKIKLRLSVENNTVVVDNI